MKLINAFLFIILTVFSHALYSTEQQLIVIRHGEAGNNVERVYNSNPKHPNYKSFHLTGAGKLAIQKLAKDLLAQGFSNDHIAAVFVSPMPRTQQTADILVQQGLVSKDKIVIDKRVSEFNVGDLEGKPTFPGWKPSMAKDCHGESEQEVRNRIKEFYDSVLRQYPQGNIIVVTHVLPSKYLIELVAHQDVILNPGEAKIVPLR